MQLTARAVCETYSPPPGQRSNAGPPAPCARRASLPKAVAWIASEAWNGRTAAVNVMTAEQGWFFFLMRKLGKLPFFKSAARFVLFEKTRETEKKTQRHGTCSLKLKDARSRHRAPSPAFVAGAAMAPPPSAKVSS